MNRRYKISLGATSGELRVIGGKDCQPHLWVNVGLHVAATRSVDQLRKIHASIGAELDRFDAARFPGGNTVTNPTPDVTAICGHVNPLGLYENEWRSWHGDRVTSDGTSTEWDFNPADVAEVIGEATSGDTWDGMVAGILRLNDGRFVAWETFYGPTGDGFSEDAYGGDADVVFASTLDHAVRFGLTDEGRNLLGIPHPEGPPP